IRDKLVTGVQTCALPILQREPDSLRRERSDRFSLHRCLVFREARSCFAKDNLACVCRVEWKFAAPFARHKTGNSPYSWHSGSTRSEERRVGKEGRELR